MAERYDKDNYNQEKNEYGRRPLWQWIVLYLIIGGLIYAVIYYLAGQY